MFAPISGADYEQRTSHNVRTLLGALEIYDRLVYTTLAAGQPAAGRRQLGLGDPTLGL